MSCVWLGSFRECWICRGAACRSASLRGDFRRMAHGACDAWYRYMSLRLTRDYAHVRC